MPDYIKLLTSTGIGYPAPQAQAWAPLLVVKHNIALAIENAPDADKRPTTLLCPYTGQRLEARESVDEILMLVSKKPEFE